MWVTFIFGLVIKGKVIWVGGFLARVPTSPNPSKGFTMKSPRIYTYKVTFEEIPDWYWGAHKEKKYEEFYLGSPDTHAWKWEFYTPCLEILELFPHTNEGWIEARKVEDRCILPDLNNPLCLNEHVGGCMSLDACRRGAKKTNEIIHAERDALGRSVQGVKNSGRLLAEKDDLGRSVSAVKGGIAAHQEKDDLGRSVNGVKNAKRLHEEKDDLGRSVQGVKNAKRLHEEKDDLGRSVNGVKNAEKTHKQIWESTMDGFRSHSGAVAQHNKANGWDPSARVRIQ